MEYGFYGRKTLYTSLNDLTSENILQEITRIMGKHSENAMSEEELYWYRRGVQPILERTKERNKFVCNKTVVNFADQAVTFRNGYFLTKPATYIGRAGANSDLVALLNGYVHNSGKYSADNKVVDWFHTVGVGVLFIEPHYDNKKVPFSCYALDPRSAGVVRSLNAGNEPVYCFNIVMLENGNSIIDVFTKTKYFKLRGGSTGQKDVKLNVTQPIEVLEEKPNLLGELPMVEYFANSNKTSCFEMAIPCMNEYNIVESNRADGIEQFIQSLLVLLGVDVEDGINAEFIKKNGMLCLPFVNDKLPKVEILAEQLDQTSTQVTLNSLKEQIHSMCGMPMTMGMGNASFENVGAAYMDRGYAICDTINRNTIDCWTESNKYATRVFLTILGKMGINIDETDLDLNFPPNEIDNLLVRTQAALNMKSIGLAPELILNKSGLSYDPISDVKQSPMMQVQEQEIENV